MLTLGHTTPKPNPSPTLKLARLGLGTRPSQILVTADLLG